jgi:hypothetical protein
LHGGEVNVAKAAACEGAWGLAQCALVFLPTCAALSPTNSVGFCENSVEPLELLGKFVKLPLLVSAFFFCVALCAFFGIAATLWTRAIERTLRGRAALRRLGLSAVVRWASSGTTIGEPIDRHAILEVAGFVATIAGVVVSERCEGSSGEKGSILDAKPA